MSILRRRGCYYAACYIHQDGTKNHFRKSTTKTRFNENCYLELRRRREKCSNHAELSVCNHRKPPENYIRVRGRGFARDSCIHRRSRKVWAPPHKNFLVKIFAPAFKS